MPRRVGPGLAYEHELGPEHALVELSAALCEFDRGKNGSGEYVPSMNQHNGKQR